MDKLSKMILDEYAQRESITLNQLSAILKLDWDFLAEPVSNLKASGFLRAEQAYTELNSLSNDAPPSISTPLSITYLGVSALEEAKETAREKRNELIRYIITTAIAVAAFLKSFFFPG